MAKIKTEQVIRRVVLGREYQIFSMKIKSGIPIMELLETITLEKRPTEGEMVEKYKVDKVVIVPTKIITGNYAVSIEEFMKIAKLVDKKEKILGETETQDTENKTETEDNEKEKEAEQK